MNTGTIVKHSLTIFPVEFIIHQFHRFGDVLYLLFLQPLLEQVHRELFATVRVHFRGPLVVMFENLAVVFFLKDSVDDMTAEYLQLQSRLRFQVFDLLVSFEECVAHCQAIFFFVFAEYYCRFASEDFCEFGDPAFFDILKKFFALLVVGGQYFTDDFLLPLVVDLPFTDQNREADFIQKIIEGKQLFGLKVVHPRHFIANRLDKHYLL